MLVMGGERRSKMKIFLSWMGVCLLVVGMILTGAFINNFDTVWSGSSGVTGQTFKAVFYLRGAVYLLAALVAYGFGFVILWLRSMTMVLMEEKEG